jgi:hypothetical protein
VEDWRLTSLINEGRAIQARISRSKVSAKKDDDTARIFANHMLEGKISSALRLLSDENNGDVLSLDSLTDTQSKTTVRDTPI